MWSTAEVEPEAILPLIFWQTMGFKGLPIWLADSTAGIIVTIRPNLTANLFDWFNPS